MITLPSSVPQELPFVGLSPEAFELAKLHLERAMAPGLEDADLFPDGMEILPITSDQLPPTTTANSRLSYWYACDTAQFSMGALLSVSMYVPNPVKQGTRPDGSPALTHVSRHDWMVGENDGLRRCTLVFTDRNLNKSALAPVGPEEFATLALTALALQDLRTRASYAYSLSRDIPAT